MTNFFKCITLGFQPNETESERHYIVALLLQLLIAMNSENIMGHIKELSSSDTPQSINVRNRSKQLNKLIKILALPRFRPWSNDQTFSFKHLKFTCQVRSNACKKQCLQEAMLARSNGHVKKHCFTSESK